MSQHPERRSGLSDDRWIDLDRFYAGLIEVCKGGLAGIILVLVLFECWNNHF